MKRIHVQTELNHLLVRHRLDRILTLGLGRQRPPEVILEPTPGPFHVLRQVKRPGVVEEPAEKVTHHLLLVNVGVFIVIVFVAFEFAHLAEEPDDVVNLLGREPLVVVVAALLARHAPAEVLGHALDGLDLLGVALVVVEFEVEKLDGFVVPIRSGVHRVHADVLVE